MVSESKILTVSYGTFSCTLEGFDDPFSTMRSIAEYFRDLAAGDRYFGAEPPIPDAEMLHRIAEREIKQRVEARIEDNSVVLRQASSDTPAQAATLVAGEVLLAEAETTQPATKPDEVEVEAEAVVETEVIPVSEAAFQKYPDEETPAYKPTAQVADIEIKAEPVQDIDLEGDSIAAKLQRIRAVVDQRASGKPDGKPSEELEDGLSDDFYAEVSQPDLTPTEVEPETEAETFADDAFEAEEFVEFEAEAGTDIEAATGNEEADDSLIADLSAVLAADEAEAPEEDAQKEISAETLELENIGALADDSDFEDDDFEDENVFAKEKLSPPMAIARVVKVRRAEVKPAEPEDMGEGDSMLSPEDEAALMAELAEVERDAGTQVELDVEAEAETDDTQDTAQALTAFDDAEISGAESLDRILAQTNTKIESDEANQKRTSIAHLRAAVQANRADSEVGDPSIKDTAEDIQGNYREDLARVVRPRRLGAGSGQASRRLAPLVLVSEQRVDEAQAEEKAETGQTLPKTIRPRRIVKPAAEAELSEDTEAASDATSGFGKFAAQAGAGDIAEFLEAAAAYQTFVKGQEVFSRPQIMKMALKNMPGSNLSREDGLRAFGKLIRQGVITKIQRGQFKISESSRFRPDQERARA